MSILLSLFILLAKNRSLDAMTSPTTNEMKHAHLAYPHYDRIEHTPIRRGH